MRKQTLLFSSGTVQYMLKDIRMLTLGRNDVKSTANSHTDNKWNIWFIHKYIIISVVYRPEQCRFI